MTVRTHISRKEFKGSVRPQRNQMFGNKPHGFWYSVDGGWEEWCESKKPEWLVGARYVVTLGRENMLRIPSLLELDVFHERYKINIGFTCERWGIDWPRVALEFDGIEIAPYRWERRLDGDASEWYYSWDCASGCVWRPRGICVEQMQKAATGEATK